MVDFNQLKQMGESAFSGSGNSEQTQQQGQGQQAPIDGQQQQQTSNTNASGSEDYGDKALDFVEKKTGHVFSRDQNEKITDGARGFYEKETGSKVNSKYSN